MNVKNSLSLGLITFYNFLFAYKYIAEQTSLGLVFSIMYVAIFLAVFYMASHYKYRWIECNTFYYGIISLFVLMALVVFHYIKVESLTADRWEGVNMFWDNVFAGKYPYNVKSQLGNYLAPMPVIFLLALPFYFIGEIGFFSLAGIILLAVFLRRTLTPRQSVTALLLVVSSAPVLWEVTVRSSLIMNTTVFLIYLAWLAPLDMNNRKNFLLSAILGGLLLSTRSIFLLVMVVYGMNMLSNRLLSFKQMLLWAGLVAFVFILPLLPFVAFYPSEFMEMNPLFMQTEHFLPLWFSILFIVFAMVMGWYCKNKQHLFFAVGLVYAFLFACYVGYNCVVYGIKNAYLGSVIDLSYGLFGFVFLINNTSPQPSPQEGGAS